MIKLQLSVVGEERLYPAEQLKPHVHTLPMEPPTGVKLQVIVVAVLVEQLRVTCVPTNAAVFLGRVTGLFCPLTVDKPVDKTNKINMK